MRGKSFPSFLLFPTRHFDNSSVHFFREMLAANGAYFVNVERRQGRILCNSDINVCGVP